jgi:uncharacterized caspase-like protein
VALDGEGRNSPFTSALARHVKVPGRSITSVMIEVRKEVLAATGNKQLPHDSSMLTGDFYFHPAGAPAAVPRTPPPPAAETESTQQRLKKLEEELARRSDPQHTVKLVELTQLKERVRQLQEESKRDQDLIFETYRKYGPVKDAPGRMALNREVGDIQRRIVVRGQQVKGLREQITKLEAEVGPPAAK